MSQAFVTFSKFFGLRRPLQLHWGRTKWEQRDIDLFRQNTACTRPTGYAQGKTKPGWPTGAS